jgi:hypothetical protein
VIGLISAITLAAIYLLAASLFSTEKKPMIEIELQCQQVENIQIFYNLGNHYNLADSRSSVMQPNADFQVMKFELPNDSILKSLRIDLGALPANYSVRRISIINHYAQKDFFAAEIIKNFKAESDISQFELINDEIKIKTTGEDPFIISNFDTNAEFVKLGQKAPQRTIPITITIFISLALVIPVRKKIKKINLKPSRLLLLTGFMLIILSPFYVMIIGMNKDQNNDEYRIKAEAPEWNMLEWESYTKKYNSYFEDQFGFRGDLIKFYSKYKTKLWRSSPIPNKVLMGKNKWLYTVEDSLMEDYRGLRKFNSNQLDEIYTNLMYRKNRLAKMGIAYYILIAPNKQTIYPEYIPSSYPIANKETRWIQTKSYLLGKGIDFIVDPTDALIKSKTSTQSYFKTDLHWSNMGAYIASNMLLNTIHKDFPIIEQHPLNHYNIREQLFTKGDLVRMINITGIHDIQYIFESDGLNNIQYLEGPAYPSYVSSQPIVLTLTKDTLKPRILMFKDSFGNGMTQFISQESSRAIYVWTHVFDWAIIEQEKPNIVIHEISEKLIHKFLEE